MHDNTGLFSGKQDDYSRFRPSYPDAAIDFLRSRSAGGCVLDIGAGTGIFTKALLRCFKNVSAVEPNKDMREKFMQYLPGIYCSSGSGEATGMPENSVDLITVAQAFHWLDAELFKQEAVRILRPEGKTAIIWNTSQKNDFTAARDRICQKYCPRFGSGHAGKRSVSEGDTFLRYSYFRKVEVVSFANPFTMDLTVFEGNMRSRSYALLPTECGYEKFMAELRSLFASHAENGFVTEPQETQIYLGTF